MRFVHHLRDSHWSSVLGKAFCWPLSFPEHPDIQSNRDYLTILRPNTEAIPIRGIKMQNRWVHIPLYGTQNFPSIPDHLSFSGNRILTLFCSSHGRTCDGIIETIDTAPRLRYMGNIIP